MGLRRELLGPHKHQPGFANSPFAIDEDDLAHTLPHLQPAVPQQGELWCTAHKRRQAMHRGHVEPALPRLCGQHPIRREGPGLPRQGVRAQGQPGKISVCELRRGSADHHRLRRRKVLQALSRGRRHTPHQRLRRRARPPGLHHHRPGMNPHPDGQGALAPQRCRHGRLPPGLHQPQTSPDRPLHIVVVSLGIAKVRRHAVRKLVRQVAVKRGDDRLAAAVEGPHDVVKVL
jgi:hypothetical protein